MRSAATYPSPAYDDPNDRRLLKIISPADRCARNAVNIMGVPFDGAVLGRKGAAGGPAAIRHALSGFSNYNLELRVGLEGARITDLGDLVTDPADVRRTHLEIEKQVRDELEESSLLALLGGDNSISLPALRALASRFDDVGLVVLDSHMDLRGEIGGAPTSGSSYGLAVETIEGLDPRNVVEIGIHGFLNSAKYAEKAKKLGIAQFTAREVRERGARDVAKEAFSIAGRGTKAVYVSVDLDAIGLGEMAGVSAPSAGGLSGQEACEIAFQVAGKEKTKCCDIVELAPDLDPSGSSKVVAASVLVYMVGGFVARTLDPF